MDTNKIKSSNFFIRFFKCLIHNIVQSIKCCYIPAGITMFIICLIYLAETNDVRPLIIFLILILICKSFVDAYESGGK